jgi:hypothetical protein
MLTIKDSASCLWDEVSLGEVMLRLDPGEGRLHTTRTFQAWEGGGKYNVARGLRRCFGLRTAHVTALADNPVGRLVEDLMLQGGVDLRYVKWVPYDGIGQRPELHRTRLRCARRAGHDHARRHQHGDAEGSRSPRQRRQRPRTAVVRWNAPSNAQEQCTRRCTRRSSLYLALVSLPEGGEECVWKAVIR